MKNTLLITCGVIAAIATLSPASAQTYKWKDERGQTNISNTPPPLSSKAKQSASAPVLTTPPALPATASDKAAPEAPKTLAEKDMEYKKKEQEAREKAQQAAKEREVEADNRRSCENARQTLNTLRSSARIAKMDQGNRKVMDSESRQQEIERAQSFIDKNCK